MATVAEAARLEPQARRALAQYDVPEPTRLELLTFSENAVFRAYFADRDPLIVRLHSVGYHTRAAVESELMWVDALRTQTDIPVPPVLRTATGAGVVEACDPEFPSRFADVLGDLPGASPETADMVADYRILGRTTAELHRHASVWRPPSGFERISWDIEGAFGAHPTWGHWHAGPNLDDAAVGLLQSAEMLIRDRLHRYGCGPSRFGLIHSDLRLSNILMDGATAQVIDFDDCGFGWFLYDLASALTFIEDDPQVPALIDSWLGGYAEVRPLEEADLTEIPTLIMMRRMVILAWLGSRPGTPVYLEEGPRYARVTAEMARIYVASGGASVLPGSN